MRRAATLALGLSGDRSGAPVLLDLIDSGDADLRAAAAVAEVRLKSANCAPLIIS